MCAVVNGKREGLAIGAKVCVVADGALVAVANNVSLALTHRAIAVNTNVLLSQAFTVQDRLVQRGKRVAWVVNVSLFPASAAVVPVRTAETLVTNTVDILCWSAYP